MLDCQETGMCKAVFLTTQQTERAVSSMNALFLKLPYRLEGGSGRELKWRAQPVPQG